MVVPTTVIRSPIRRHRHRRRRRVVLEALRARPDIARVIGARPAHRRRPIIRAAVHNRRLTAVDPARRVPYQPPTTSATRSTNHHDAEPDPPARTDGAVASYCNEARKSPSCPHCRSSPTHPSAPSPVRPTEGLPSITARRWIPRRRHIRLRRHRITDRMVVPTTVIRSPIRRHRHRRRRRVVLEPSTVSRHRPRSGASPSPTPTHRPACRTRAGSQLCVPLVESGTSRRQRRRPRCTTAMMRSRSADTVTDGAVAASFA